MPTYRVVFGRIGRNKDIGPLTANAADADALALEVFRYAKPHLRSRDLEVSVDLEAGTGAIYAGMHVAGEFTIEETQT